MNNCVHADDSSGVVLLIHGQDPFPFGGSSLNLRYDVSTDRGITWWNDIGPLNPVLANGRRPQVGVYRPVGDTTPSNSSVVFIGEGFNGTTWAGLATGTASFSTTSQPTTQEANVPGPAQTPDGGMTQRVPGEFWTARFDNSGGAADSLRIYKGIFDPGTQNTTWTQHAAISMPWDLSVNGSRWSVSPSIAFSPDGSTGWIATLGDLTGVMDSVYAPILLKSTNGGTSWGAPTEIDLDGFPWLADSLRALWVDSLGNPASSGKAGAAFHYDLTVDANGNPHMFFVVGTGLMPGNPSAYTLYSGLSKYGVDLSSTNQGSSYTLRLVAPMLTLRGSFGSVNAINQDNYPQVSRTHDGQHIFYSWVDSDTAQFTGNLSGIGFGVSDNLAPNLRIAGYRVADGFSTCIHMVTDGDLIWEGLALNMQLAPEVLQNGSGLTSYYNLPIVGISMLTADPNSSCQYWYFGNDAVLTEGDFAYPPGSSVYWFGCTVSAAFSAQIQGKVYLDLNTNGSYDGADIALPNRTVATSPLNYTGLTDANGDYNILSLINQTYGLSTASINPALWTLMTPSVPYSLTPITPGTVLAGNDFGFAAAIQAEDLGMQLLGSTMRPGFAGDIQLYISNQGTLPTAGTVVLHYDNWVDVTATNPPYTSMDTVARTVTWSLPTLQLFSNQSIQVALYLPPSAPLGTWLQFSAQVSPTGIDAVPANNNDAISVQVIGSYDPNDKSVFPAGNGLNHQVDPGTALKYRIRFQNTGTASAINVVVRDTLDTDLEVLNLQALGASHAHSLSIEQGRILVWTFNGINLPDSNTNEPASHGYIDFSIGPKPGLPLGTVVENSASIYFDFNAPVLTNTAWITYDVPSATQPPLPAPAIRVYPVPASTAVVVEYQRHEGQVWTLELLDLQGRRVHQSTSDQASYTLARNGLPAGIYLYRVTTADGRAKTGKLVFD